MELPDELIEAGKGYLEARSKVREVREQLTSWEDAAYNAYEIFLNRLYQAYGGKVGEGDEQAILWLIRSWEEQP